MDPNKAFWSWSTYSEIPNLDDDTLLSGLRYGNPNQILDRDKRELLQEAKKRKHLVPKLVALKLKGLI